MSTRYRRVPQNDGDSDESKILKNERAKRIERITEKVHSAFWVGLSIIILYYTNIINQAFHDERVQGIALTLAIICFTINICLVIYSTIWLPLVVKIRVPTEIYAPKIIPLSAALGVSTIILFMYAFWPIYGFLTPLLIMILTLGLLFSTHFIPWPI